MPADERDADAGGRPLPPETELLLFRARHAASAAEQLLAEGNVAGAALRAYHAMADGAAALLTDVDRERARTPIRLHAAFWSRAVRGGRVEPALHDWLLEAYAASGRDGAEAPPALSTEDVARLIAHARAFLEAVHRSLGRRPPRPA